MKLTKIETLMEPVVYFAGSPEEVSHHAAPLRDRLTVRMEPPDRVLELAKPGDLVIFYSEHFDRFRQACVQLRQHQVATLYMIDGILEWRNAWENSPTEVACPYTMRPVLSDKVACIGLSQARTLEAWGNSGKTEVVGIPRFDPLFRAPATRVGDDEFRVLVMTAKTPAFTNDQLDRVRLSLTDIYNWAATSPQLNGRTVRVVWRLTRDLDRELGVDNQLSDLTGGELSEQLASVDAVITTPSTAMLEAMLQDLPVALLDYHHTPLYVQSGWRIGNAEQIDGTMRDMAARTESKMLFQRNELYDALYLQSSAVDRFVELVEAMLQSAKLQLKTSDRLHFPPQMISPPGNLSAEFVHQRLFPSAVEFSQTPQNQLAVELSHARREIDHLNRELNQALHELDQAHQIFKAINEHPIAGPIVRIRQKMMDWMAAIGKRPQIHQSPPVPEPEPFKETTVADTTENASTV